MASARFVTQRSEFAGDLLGNCAIRECRREVQAIPVGDLEFVVAGTVGVEGAARTVIPPSVDLDRQLQFGVREVDPAPLPIERDPMLLDRFRQIGADDRTQDPHLEPALGLVVVVDARAQHGVDPLRAPARGRRETSHASAEFREG